MKADHIEALENFEFFRIKVGQNMICGQPEKFK